MLRSQQGSVYRVVLGCFIILAFCFALIWPQYSKRHDTKQLLQAAELGRKLAFAEETYKQTAGQYTPQFGKLNLSLPCPLLAQDGQTKLACKAYTFTFENEHFIHAKHKQLPVWLEIDISAGTVACNYEAEDWAGQNLCAHMQ